MEILKLLLVGFTEQNANVIQMFIELTFENVKVNRVPKLPEGTAPKMPELTVLEAESDIFVMDAESIGFDFKQISAASEQINQIIPNKSILLISRHALPSSTSDQLSANLQWLSVPYTRKQMAEKLQQLISDVSLKQTTINSPMPTRPIDRLPPADNAVPVFEAQKPQTTATDAKTKPVAIVPDKLSQSNEANFVNKTVTANDLAQETQTANALFDLLNRTFSGLAAIDFFDIAQTLYQLQDYTLVSINGHYLYLNPFDQSIVASRLDRIVDHFMIGQNLRQSFMNRQILTEEAFHQQTARHLADGDKKITFGQLIWHLGLEMLPRNAFDENHSLAIEVRFMPNLAGINFVPSYVLPLISSCLGRSRTLQDFHQLFPQLTNAQVNQVIILLIMSQAVNSKVLLNGQAAKSSLSFSTNLSQTSANTTNTMPSATTIQQSASANVASNEGVAKAQQTGFLKRLLGKLGVKVS